MFLQNIKIFAYYLCLFMLLFHHVVTATEGILHVKVSNQLPQTISNDSCYFGSMEDIPNKSKTSYPLSCLQHCGASLDKCFLTCTNGKICKFYRAIVSKAWVPNISDITDPELTNFDCFSSYYANNVLNDNIENITSSAPLYPGHPTDIAINGYYCNFDLRYFRTPTFDLNYLIVKLNAVYEIKKVVVHARGMDNKGFPPTFEKVQVRVGNSEDFERNKYFDYFEGPAVENEIVVFGNKGSVRGKYVSLQTFTKKLVFADLKIIG